MAAPSFSVGLAPFRSDTVPILLSFVSVIALNGVLAPASGVGQKIGRTLALAICSILVLAITDKLARRFVPLAALCVRWSRHAGTACRMIRLAQPNSC